MDEFEVIYKILRFLNKSMDCDELDLTAISSERFGITKKRWLAIIEMLADRKYIDGVQIYRHADGGLSVNIDNLRITLSGLEYLKNDSNMIECAKKAKGI